MLSCSFPRRRQSRPMCLSCESYQEIEVKVGDLIKVADHMVGVNPVGIVVELIPGDYLDRAMVLYLDGDYEELACDTEYEVISENR